MNHDDGRNNVLDEYRLLLVLVVLLLQLMVTFLVAQQRRRRTCEVGERRRTATGG